MSVKFICNHNDTIARHKAKAEPHAWNHLLANKPADEPHDVTDVMTF